MRALCLVNPTAGSSDMTDAVLARIRERLAAANVDAEVVVVAAADLAGQLERLRDGTFDAVIAGGGDGTLNAVAARVAGTATLFGVLPLGTHNHFAKDLGIPLDLDAALDSFANAKVRAIDVAEVNGRLFLNFSAIGFHPMIVKHREAQRHAKRRSKFVAMLVAVSRNLRTFRLWRTRIEYEGQVQRRLTPLLIVCNNPHQMSVFGVADVSCAQRGMLNLYLTRATRWWQFAWLLLRAVFRSLDSKFEFDVLVSSQFDVTTRGSSARVSIDGEVMDLELPLRYRIRRAGLSLLVPADAKTQTG